MEIDSVPKAEVDSLFEELAINLLGKNLPNDHAGKTWLKGTLAVNFMAMLDVGAIITWNYTWGREERKYLEKLRKECTKKTESSLETINEQIGKG